MAPRSRTFRGKRGFTLIEELIVVAILAIMSATLLQFFLGGIRVERACARQQEALEQIMLLERTWREDVYAAKSLPAQYAGETIGEEMAVVEVVDRVTSSVETRVYRVSPNSDNTFAVDRTRLDEEGSELSRQRLATSLDIVKFGRDGRSGMMTLEVSATRGFSAFNSKQEFVALAAPGVHLMKGGEAR
jgi:prepilin-type N-terminal cleavage/methylation domain-containing protein